MHPNLLHGIGYRMTQTNTAIQNLLVIDSQVTDWQSLAAGAGADTAVLILDSGADGLTQISDYLSNTSTSDLSLLQSIQIISHGSAGSLQLGSSTISSSNLSLYTKQLAKIGSSLTDTGDILLYGCNVAAGQAGLDFINQLSVLTNADIAASNDLTGSAALNGNWQLEANTGAIEVHLNSNVTILNNYASILVLDTLAPVAPKLITNAAFNSLNDPQLTLQTSLGSVVLELNPEQAPITVANMLAYANTGFYDNTLFHRVIAGFMVQGGGFTSGLVNEAPTYSPIVLESNNSLSNLRGTIAMARTNVANSATSQFFVNLVDNSFLNYSSSVNPGYAVFGKVVSGMSVIDSIAQVPTKTVGNYANVPVTDVTIISAQQTLVGSSITNAARLTVSDLEVGATWDYSLNNGSTWITGTGNSFNVPVGDYVASAIQVRQTDAAGNVSSSAGKLTSALVVETTAPTVTSFTPTDGATSVAIGSNIDLTFSEAIQKGTGTIAIHSGSADGAVVESFDAATSNLLSITGNTLTINPSIDLGNNTQYFVTFAAGTVKDMAGNNYAGTSTYDFITAVATNVTNSTVGNDKLVGTNASDTLNGGKGANTMTGGLGSDTYYVDNTGDKVIERKSAGTDTVYSSISFILGSNVENLNLTGKAALNGTGNALNNILIGNSAANKLSGLAGNDILNGGLGKDILTGGNGKDIFKLTTLSKDTITDFSVKDDTLQLENSVFGKLIKTGVFSTANFKVGAATDNNDYVLYNSNTGVVSYDANGNGAGGTTQIALLGAHLALTHLDFFVI